ncbi:MAG TPA: trehalase family glycosidase [Polyangia bacterium]|jgi:alpha,alpha-trehalase
MSARRRPTDRSALRVVVLALASLFACAAPRSATPAVGVAAAAPPPASPDHLQALRAYIRTAWAPLTRTRATLPEAAIDPKFPRADGSPWPVYVPHAVDPRAIDAELTAILPPAARATLALLRLPDGHQPPAAPGLLYLPRPYVVPGGRFNEMYGWDSYFILLGLLTDGRVAQARDITDDFLYEVENYGGVLNANRTYYLTRGQPPFLSEMVLAVYHATGDRRWLAAARDAVVAEHAHWTAPPHLIPGLGLSRYFDHGEGPAPEVVAAERDARGLTHYDRVRAWYRAHPDAARGSSTFYDAASDRLTPLFFKGDRSMRESGFDPSDRFGPFGADVIHYAPVCLNTLLFAMENDLADIDGLLGRDADAAAWKARAQERLARIDEVLWDEAAGLYYDYDFSTHHRRAYAFATTFWPLWAGLASREQAARVHANLPLFERPGGVVTSTTISGSQWDAPFGWAPLQMFAVEGLRRAGFGDDADRIAKAFLSMLGEDFARRGTLLEKYDVVRRTSMLGDALTFGYTSNEVGFGWTNGVALMFLEGTDSRAPLGHGPSPGSP